MPRSLTTKKKKGKTASAIEIVRRRYFEGRPERLAELAQARVDDDVARKVRALRSGAGLSQRRLADLVGTTASVINRLEAADYDGHSLTMLRRIGAAVHHRVVVEFVPEDIQQSRPRRNGPKSRGKLQPA